MKKYDTLHKDMMNRVKNFIEFRLIMEVCDNVDEIKNDPKEFMDEFNNTMDERNFFLTLLKEKAVHDYNFDIFRAFRKCGTTAFYFMEELDPTEVLCYDISSIGLEGIIRTDIPLVDYIRMGTNDELIFELIMDQFDLGGFEMIIGDEDVTNDQSRIETTLSKIYHKNLI